MEKYENIVIISLDRSLVQIENLRKYLNENENEKIQIICMDDINDSVLTCVSRWKSYIKSPEKTSVILFSITELVFRYNYNLSLKILTEIQSWNLCCFIASLHSTLHDGKSRSIIEDQFSTICYAIPNDGMFSDEVLAEIQTIRKSLTSGKVTESTELFGWKQYKTGKAMDNKLSEGILYCMHKNKVYNSMMVSDMSNQASNMEQNADAQVAPQPPKSQSVVLPTTKRLITFDSTDPEFDDDSDPDADLDL